MATLLAQNGMLFNRQRKANHTDALRPPSLWLTLLEGRAPLEYAASLAAKPWLRKLPTGDGHPVLVFPGLGASDISTLPLRSFLQDRGYVPCPWKQGFNFGPRKGVLRACRDEVDAIYQRHQRPVSLIGWSLGGIYAREIAKEVPERTRCVITLGTPFAGNPHATHAWRFYRMVSGQRTHDESLSQQIREAPPVPTTSIYSRTDGIVAWQCSINMAGPLTENIEVHASHVGMGLNPLALYAIADRLAQDPRHWRHFEAAGARRWFFRTGAAHAAIA